MPMTLGSMRARSSQRVSPGLELRIVVQREDPEVIVVAAMALGRHRAPVAELAEIVLPLGELVGRLGEVRHRFRDVVEHPVHEAVGAVRGDEGSVGIVANHREGARALGRVGPRKLGRDVRSLPRMLDGIAPPAANAVLLSFILDKAKPMASSLAWVERRPCLSRIGAGGHRLVSSDRST